MACICARERVFLALFSRASATPCAFFPHIQKKVGDTKNRKQFPSSLFDLLVLGVRRVCVGGLPPQSSRKHQSPSLSSSSSEEENHLWSEKRGEKRSLLKATVAGVAAAKGNTGGGEGGSFTRRRRRRKRREKKIRRTDVLEGKWTNFGKDFFLRQKLSKKHRNVALLLNITKEIDYKTFFLGEIHT